MSQTAPAAAPSPASPASPGQDSILLYSGRYFRPLAPDPADITIEDIAVGLSNVCRYGGHVKPNYNVAHHSLLVSRWVPPEFALVGLMHDAPKGMGLNDMVAPIKHHDDFAAYRAAEERLWRVIAQVFGLPAVIPAAVMRIDVKLRVDEMRSFKPDPACGARPHGVKPETGLGIIIDPMGHEEAEVAFLARFHDLMARRDAAEAAK